MARVTPSTNRVSTFAEAHGLTVQEVVRWNRPYFEASRTVWLPLDEDFATEAPRIGSGHALVIDGGYLLVNGDILVV